MRRWRGERESGGAEIGREREGGRVEIGRGREAEDMGGERE